MKYCFPSGNCHGKRKKRCTIKDTVSIKITFMHYRNYYVSKSKVTSSF